MIFKYTIINQYGQKISGRASYKNEEIARKHLEKEGGGVILELKKTSEFWQAFAEKTSGALNRKQRIEFFNNFHSLLDLGISHIDALKDMEYNITLNSEIRIMSGLIASDLEKGELFAKSLAMRGFPSNICELIDAGAKVGKFNYVIHSVYKSEDLQEKISKGWKSVLAAPIIMSFFVFVGTIAALEYLVPMIREVTYSIAGSNEALIPMSSMIVFKAADYRYWIFGGVMGSIIGIIVIYKLVMIKFPAAKRKMGYFVLKLPIAGAFNSYKELAAISSTLSLTLGSGFSEETAMDYARKQVQNPYMLDKMNKIYHLIKRKGKTLTEAMEEEVINMSLVNIVKMGQIKGKDAIAEKLDQASDHYVELTLYNLDILKKSTELLNLIFLSIVASPLLYITVVPQLDQITMMISFI